MASSPPVIPDPPIPTRDNGEAYGVFDLSQQPPLAPGKHYWGHRMLFRIFEMGLIAGQVRVETPQVSPQHKLRAGWGTALDIGGPNVSGHPRIKPFCWIEKDIVYQQIRPTRAKWGEPRDYVDTRYYGVGLRPTSGSVCGYEHRTGCVEYYWDCYHGYLDGPVFGQGMYVTDRLTYRAASLDPPTHPLAGPVAAGVINKPWNRVWIHTLDHWLAVSESSQYCPEWCSADSAYVLDWYRGPGNYGVYKNYDQLLPPARVSPGGTARDWEACVNGPPGSPCDDNQPVPPRACGTGDTGVTWYNPSDGKTYRCMEVMIACWRERESVDPGNRPTYAGSVGASMDSCTCDDTWDTNVPGLYLTAASREDSGWPHHETRCRGMFKILPGPINNFTEYRYNKDVSNAPRPNVIERYVPRWDRGTRDQRDDVCWDGTEYRWVAWVDHTPPDNCD
jgi:hypothetical protein